MRHAAPASPGAFPRGYDAVSYPQIGERAFWSAVRAFTQAAIHDGSRTVDLRRAFERAAGRPLPIFDRAVYGGGAP